MWLSTECPFLTPGCAIKLLPFYHYYYYYHYLPTYLPTYYCYCYCYYH